MSNVFESVQGLVRAGLVRVSEHAYDELAEDQVTVREVVTGVAGGIEIEVYPEYPKGPCTLVLQRDSSGRAIHVVWGIPKGHDGPAVVVTAYRPDPELWDTTLTRRRSG